MLKTRKGFSLIELLVVICIITVLLGLLIVAVQKVRNFANNSVCQNNLKQLTLSVVDYYETTKRFPNTWYLHDFGKGSNLPYCPFATFPLYKDDSERLKYQAPYNSHYTYGYNQMVGTGKRVRKDLLQKTTTLCFNDSVRMFKSPIGTLTGEAWSMNPGGYGHFRHPGNMIFISFLDGHVTSIKGQGQEIGYPFFDMFYYTGIVP